MHGKPIQPFLLLPRHTRRKIALFQRIFTASTSEEAVTVARELDNQMGRISLSEEVIATIAGVAATECYGIVGMASTKIKDGIAELLGRENLSRGVEVDLDDSTVDVTLYVVVGYGTKISEVAHNVVDKVKYTVESTTGLKVRNVSVRVQGVKVGNAR